MGAGHTHGTSANDRNRKRLSLVLVLVVGYMAAEVIGGLVTGSLALMADVGHMFSDAAALALSLFAIWIAQRPATPRRTFGYYRTEILAALVNGATLIAISIYIFIEAYRRIGAPPEVQGGLMMAIATGGLAVNLFGLWILNAGKSDSLNVKGAWLHVLTDSLGSAGAMVAGGLIWAFGWNWVDPAISVLIGVLVLYSSWALLKETVGVLMEGTPGHIDVDEVRNVMVGTPGVQEVYDLHVWSITSGMEAMSAHVVVNESEASAPLVQLLKESLHDRFGIDHATIEVDTVGRRRERDCAF